MLILNHLRVCWLADITGLTFRTSPGRQNIFVYIPCASDVRGISQHHAHTKLIAPTPWHARLCMCSPALYGVGMVIPKQWFT